MATDTRIATSADQIARLIQSWPRLFRGHAPTAPSDLPPGWFRIVDDVFRQLDALFSDDDARRFCVLQIKQKLGGLRVYWKAEGGQPKEQANLRMAEPFCRVANLVQDAERRCAASCEMCGAPGELRRASHQQILCDRHTEGRT